MNAILDDLAFDTDPARVDPFEQAVADLATHLGITTQRPERDFKRGPDGLWGFGDQSYAVIECKNAAVTDFIRKTDLDQLSGSLSWFRREYELPASALALMIHPSNKVHPTSYVGAVRRPGRRNGGRERHHDARERNVHHGERSQRHRAPPRRLGACERSIVPHSRTRISRRAVRIGPRAEHPHRSRRRH